jgi:hypothetical protein
MERVEVPDAVNQAVIVEDQEPDKEDQEGDQVFVPESLHEHGIPPQKWPLHAAKLSNPGGAKRIIYQQILRFHERITVT